MEGERETEREKGKAWTSDWLEDVMLVSGALFMRLELSAAILKCSSCYSHSSLPQADMAILGPHEP